MKNFYIHLWIALILQTSVFSQNCQGNWLSTDGNKLLDAKGNEVILAGVNWFGFETQISIPHGLYARDVEGMLQQTKDLGFNCLRIPWHNLMLRDDAKVQAPNYWVKDPYTYNGVPEQGPYSNLDLQGKSKPIEIMDYLIQWCQDNDMKVILDCHSRNPDAYLIEKLWYTDNVPQDQWIKDWVFMAERYKDFDAVIGMDINNEPNGKIDNPKGARWGNNDPKTDWRLASEKCGNAILAVNPNVLIMVEGIEAYNKPDGTPTSYWWGGNLQGARDFPVRLSNPNKLMYSPHEYGPTVYNQKWFSASDFPDNMPDIWETQFNFLNTNNVSPLLIGELGIRGQGGKDEIWFAKFVDFIKKKKLHFTFWALNPNSGDTGGILEHDWSTVVQWKMDYLKPILSNPIPNSNCLSKTTLSSVHDSELSSSSLASVIISPNPTTRVLQFNANKELIQSITIFDINGKVVDTIDFKSSVTRLYEHDVSQLTPGLYITQITTNNTTKGKISKLFIKE